MFGFGWPEILGLFVSLSCFAIVIGGIGLAIWLLIRHINRRSGESGPADEESPPPRSSESYRDRP